MVNPIEGKTRKTCTIHKGSDSIYNAEFYITNQNCSGITKKNKYCSSRKVFYKYENELYCMVHRPNDECAEVVNHTLLFERSQAAIDKIPDFLLVVPIEKPINHFKQVKCNYKNCSIETFYSIDRTVWICPIHEDIS